MTQKEIDTLIGANNIIAEKDLPMPRLELRWLKGKNDDWYEKICEYSLILPVEDFDIRDEEKNNGFLKVSLGGTTSTGGSADAPPIHILGQSINTPFRDGAHIRWDGKNLRLPMFVVCSGIAQQLLANF